MNTYSFWANKTFTSTCSACLPFRQLPPAAVTQGAFRYGLSHGTHKQEVLESESASARVVEFKQRLMLNVARRASVSVSCRIWSPARAYVHFCAPRAPVTHPSFVGFFFFFAFIKRLQQSSGKPFFCTIFLSSLTALNISETDKMPWTICIICISPSIPSIASLAWHMVS